MRCPDCNRFVFLEYEVEEAEGTVELDAKGKPNGLTIHVIANGNCAECGTTLTTGEWDIEHEISPLDFEEQ